MANEHLQKYLRMSREVTNIFNELDEYLEFCKKQGYVFDEAHLGNEKTPWGEWQRVKAGKHPRTIGVRSPRKSVSLNHAIHATVIRTGSIVNGCRSRTGSSRFRSRAFH